MSRRAALVSLTALWLGCASSRTPAPPPTSQADDSAEVPSTPDSGVAPETPDAGSHTDAAPEPRDAEPPVLPTTPPAAAMPSRLEPLARPQPSAAGVLEACAFEPASKAAEGSGPSCPGGVYRGDLLIDSAEDADAVADCTRVEGDVEMIGGDAALANFTRVRVVTGDFLIRASRDTGTCWGKGAGSPACRRGGVSPNISLEPLRALRCVGGDFVIGTGAEPESQIPADLSPLASLVEVGGHFVPGSGAEHRTPPFTSLQRVWGTVEIADVDWLPVLDTVYGRVTTHIPSNNARVSPLEKSAVPSLRYLGCGGADAPCRDGVLGCSVTVSKDEQLAPYKACSVIVGDLKLDDLTVTDLSSLAGLRVVRGTLSLISTRVADLNALAELDRATGVYLEYNSRLNDISGLDGIAFRSMYIGDNTLLRDLSAWRALRPLGHVDLTFNLYKSLETIGDWPWLVRARSFQVTGGGLTHLGRFDNLTRVGEFGLRGVTDLQVAGSFPALSALDQLAVGAAPALKRLPDFPALSSKLTQLEITESGILDVRGLEKAAEIGHLVISRNAALTSLNGFSGLKAVNGRFLIQENQLLISLHGLSSITTIEELYITTNPSLTDCELQWLINQIGRPQDLNRFEHNAGPGPCAAP